MTRIIYWEDALGKTISSVICAPFSELTLKFTDETFMIISTLGERGGEEKVCIDPATYEKLVDGSLLITPPSLPNQALTKQQIKEALISRRIISLLVPLIGESIGNPTLPSPAVKMGLVDEASSNVSMYWIYAESMAETLSLVD
ncbi:hypothetical protein D3C86_344160 [compost metagenome]